MGRSDAEVRALLKEVTIQSRLPPHPNLVGLLASFLTEPAIIVIADYMERGDLKKVYTDQTALLTRIFSNSMILQLIDSYKREDVGLDSTDSLMPEDEVKRIAKDVFSGLHFLHSNRIVHRYDESIAL